jgi:hypothetical protein
VTPAFTPRLLQVSATAFSVLEAGLSQARELVQHSVGSALSRRTTPVAEAACKLLPDDLRTSVPDGAARPQHRL